MKARLELGDVFAVPLDADRAGVGQVVATYGQGAFYFAIFDLMVHPDEAHACVDEALAADLLFLAPSLDSRLPVPYLTVIGSRPVRPGLPLPAHREVDADNLVQVVDYSGRRRRPATDDEARRLQNRRFVAPLRLARALRATAGMEPWNDTYAALIPDEELSSDRLFGPQPASWSRVTPTGALPLVEQPPAGATQTVEQPPPAARRTAEPHPSAPLPKVAPHRPARSPVAAPQSAEV
ncbi:MAG: hypothetical protein FWD18_09310 [Micrococcales bacterium]|nr:hypothetical protein [Micrococcales bacterium]